MTHTHFYIYYIYILSYDIDENLFILVRNLKLNYMITYTYLFIFMCNIKLCKTYKYIIFYLRQYKLCAIFVLLLSDIAQAVRGLHFFYMWPYNMSYSRDNFNMLLICIRFYKIKCHWQSKLNMGHSPTNI